MKPAFLEPPGKSRRTGRERMRKRMLMLFSFAMLFLSAHLALVVVMPNLFQHLVLWRIQV